MKPRFQIFFISAAFREIFVNFTFFFLFFFSLSHFSAKEMTRDDGSYFFTGDGYAAMQGLSSTVYNKYFFSVSFNFKTFDENSMLFYAAGVKPVR